MKNDIDGAREQHVQIVRPNTGLVVEMLSLKTVYNGTV